MNDQDWALSTLADRQLIRDLLAAYCARIDEGDIDAYRGLFTQDCVCDYGGGVMDRGVDALIARASASQSRFRRTHHGLGASLLDITGDRASGTSYVLGFHELWDGGESWVGARFEDTFLRTPSGWRIATRTTVVHAATGSLAGQPWNWIQRGPAVSQSRPD